MLAARHAAQGNAPREMAKSRHTIWPMAMPEGTPDHHPRNRHRPSLPTQRPLDLTSNEAEWGEQGKLPSGSDQGHGVRGCGGLDGRGAPRIGVLGQGQGAFRARIPVSARFIGCRVNTRLSLEVPGRAIFLGARMGKLDLTRLYREYVGRKQKNRALDFDDFLLDWHGSECRTRRWRRAWRKIGKHVLVDEYQDTSTLQGEIVQALKPDGKGVTVVGDDAQAIYSFRAAAVENILGFADRYKPKAEIVVLAQTYRSTQQVLDSANALMSEARASIARPCWACANPLRRPATSPWMTPGPSRVHRGQDAGDA